MERCLLRWSAAESAEELAMAGSFRSCKYERERETAKESDSDYGEEELGLKDPTRIGGLKRRRTFTYPAYNSILL